MFEHHNAIRRVYPNIKLIDDDLGCFDYDGNLVEIDEQLVAVARIENDKEEYFTKLRYQRNRLLAETDYLALADATLTDEMRAYRQALRDLPANTSDPANVVWPTKPN